MHKERFNWDDLQVFLAVARTQSTVKAAVQLKVNQSTVSRRMSALEEALGTTLFERRRKGIGLTHAGKALEPHALQMEAAGQAIFRALRVDKETPQGRVKVATVEEIAEYLMVPALGAFHQRYPQIEIDILTSVRLVDLVRGDADVALRLVGPDKEGLVGRKVGGFGFGIYATARFLEDLNLDGSENPNHLDWIILEGAHPSPYEKDWFHENFPNVKPILRCNSFKTQVSAVQAGLGVTLLPNPMAHRLEGLVRLPYDTRKIRRDIWLVVHRDLRAQPAIQVVMEFLASLMTPPAR